jgi:hypothetical protein
LAIVGRKGKGESLLVRFQMTRTATRCFSAISTAGVKAAMWELVGLFNRQIFAVLEHWKPKSGLIGPLRAWGLLQLAFKIFWSP